MTTSAEPPDIPHVVAPPPLIYGVPLLAGLLLQDLHPMAALSSPWAHVLGPIFVVLGLLAFPALLAFRRAGTHPEPWIPTSTLVLSGPYRFTRNPMYVGMTALYLGVSLWVNTLWPLLALPFVLLLMRYGVVAREEAYLERRFGQAYREYRGRVRRWL
ncbi:MAG TPA: isoprenylcysteine carboxylmethyltransferase family protein [Gemmatimonadales bacterium]|nr:isoprenylcysteine carboxylmethyltransferase family protein [Gemmatimonadales bacterium]